MDISKYDPILFYIADSILNIRNKILIFSKPQLVDAMHLDWKLQEENGKAKKLTSWQKTMEILAIRLLHALDPL